MRIGLEIECWVIDERGKLVDGDTLIDAHSWVDPECVKSLVEVKTPPCETVEELLYILRERLEDVIESGRAHGRRLVPLGTPLADDSLQIRQHPRITVQREVLGNTFEYACHCAGTHLHFEQDTVQDQLRLLTALDPAIALVNTTPYCRGQRVAACARPYAYRRLCYHDLPEHGQLWPYPATVSEWYDRLNRCAKEFVEIAADRTALNRNTLDSLFAVPSAVWTPVRLRNDLGTVEWRSPDAMPFSDLVTFVTDVTQIIESARTVGIGDSPPVPTTMVTIPPFEELGRLVYRAITTGLNDPAVLAYLESIGFDPSAYRPVGDRHDGRSWISDDKATEIRLRHADRLETEVESMEGELGVDRASPMLTG